jgi:hypothetical protein
VFNHDKLIAWLGQPHLIKNLESKFGFLVDQLQKYRTPGTPGNNFICPKKEDAKV